MSKKSCRYEGYIFFESLVAFTVTCIIIGHYFSLLTFLLEAKQESFAELTMRRILYEELKQFENGNDSLQRIRNENNREYVITFSLEGSLPVKMEITDGKKVVTINK